MSLETPILPDPSPAPAAAAPAPTVPSNSHEALALQLAREFLDEKRHERRWRVVLRLSWLALVAAVVWTLWSQQNPVVASGTPHTALVELRGEIAADTEASAELVVSALKSAFADVGAKAVVLRINSPGGSPVQAGIVYDEIRRLRALHNKPVYAVVDDICTSAAYYIAAATDDIYVDKASMVGSIGVLMDDFGYTGLMSKLGVERRLLTAGEHKGLLDAFSPLPPADRARVQLMLDEIHGQFIAAVREGRGKRLKEDGETFSGLMWNGSSALKMGLVDGLGNLDHVAREIVGAEEVIDYTPQPNVAERLAKRFGAAVGEGAVKAWRSLPKIR